MNLGSLTGNKIKNRINHRASKTCSLCQFYCMGFNKLRQILGITIYQFKEKGSKICSLFFNPFSLKNPEKFYIWDHKEGFLRGNCTLNQNCACFVHYFKIINIFLKNNIGLIILQNIALINNSRTVWPTKILMSFLSLSDNLL